MTRQADAAAETVVDITGEKGGDLRLSLKGPVCLDNFSQVQESLQSLWSRLQPRSLTLDLGQVGYLDSAGALILVEFQAQARERRVPLEVKGLSPRLRDVLEIIHPEGLAQPSLRPAPQPPDFVSLMGQGFLSFVQDFIELHIFLGELLFALGRACRHPGEVRWSEVLLTMKRMGLDGLPILSLMSVLLGMVIAFMSALQLQQFGATLYVASLVSISMVKELGPILTAILVAGRSGSAFAAEIGTMQVNEEVDALLVMGFDPLGFLAVPKVLASVLVVPILTVYASFFGILGGLMVGVALLDLTLYTYVNESYLVLTVFDIVTTLLKVAVFGVTIAAIGCQRGFKVRGGAEAVGIQTTSAVVASLFMIIVIDSVFAVVLHYAR